MAKYQKWLGAGLGWAITGNPLGGLLGFLAGHAFEKNRSQITEVTGTVSELEANLIVLASYLIKVNQGASLRQIEFTSQFLDKYFGAENTLRRQQMLNHCLQHEYDLNIVCDQLRMYTERSTRIQIVRFLFDLALSKGGVTSREEYFIFKVSGYLTVNDVEFKMIKEEQTLTAVSAFDVLGLSVNASPEQIRNAYRKLVLKYHPDRNSSVTEIEKKQLAVKFQQIQEAYEKLKSDKGF